jgi:hypothetical protein
MWGEAAVSDQQAQQQNVSVPPEALSRFRSPGRVLTREESALDARIAAKAEELAALFDQLKPVRYRALAHTNLEMAVAWATKGLTE